MRTRPEPKPYAGGRVFHVYPHGFKGPKIEPSFEGLMCAYNFWCAGTDWATSGRPRVRPGDTILVHAGVYKYNRYEYTNNASVNRTTPLDGTYYLTADGTPEMPIAIKAAGDGEVIFDGDGASRCSTCAPPTTPTSRASRSGTPRWRSRPARSSSPAPRV